MKRNKKLLLLLFALAITFSGCGFLSTQNSTTTKDLAMIASGISDYREQVLLASTGKVDKEDFEGSISSKTLYTDERIVVLPDGTVVTIVEVLDDNNTPEDPQDDIITVTRSFEFWQGAERLEKIVRPGKPGPEWDCWVEVEDGTSRCVQDGILNEIYIEGVKIKQGLITVTWRKQGDDTVLLEKIEKEIYSITREGAVERVVIEIDEDGLQTMTLYRIRITATGDEVVVHSFTFEEFVDNGDIYTKIIRDDGYYFIVIQPKDPKIIESYDPDGILLTRTTEFLDRETGELSIEKEFFDKEGNLIETRNCTMRFIFLGDEIIITKTFDMGFLFCFMASIKSSTSARYIFFKSALTSADVIPVLSCLASYPLLSFCR